MNRRFPWQTASVLSLLVVLAIVAVAVVTATRDPRTPEPSGQAAASEARQSQTEVIPTMTANLTPLTEEEIKAAQEAGTIPVSIETTRGTIRLELRGDLMPITVANFVKLAESGFYDGLTFHRVEPNFVIQGGDPQGTGMGGPGYSIKLETHPELKNVRGGIAMARSSHPDSAGSQFYILHRAAPHLDGSYAVFGNVVEGLDVVDAIRVGDRMTKVTVGE